MSDVAGTARAAKNLRYPILDALRSILALWVTVDHLGVFPLFAWADPRTKLGRFLVHGWATVAARYSSRNRIFIISGFCIHFHSATAKNFIAGRYYARRLCANTRAGNCGARGLEICRLQAGPVRRAFNSVGSRHCGACCAKKFCYLLYPLIRRIRWRYRLDATFICHVPS